LILISSAILIRESTGRTKSVKHEWADFPKRARCSKRSFEFGPEPLNPYEQFKHLKPDVVIQHGGYVFNGHFEIPLAAAFSHAQRAQNLLDAKDLVGALSEAQQSVDLAPGAVVPNAVLGTC
jgi:hypothetical protein